MGRVGDGGRARTLESQVAEVGGGLGCGLETGRTVRRMQMMTSHNTTLQDKGL